MKGMDVCIAAPFTAIWCRRRDKNMDKNGYHPSYENYTKILKLLQQTGKYMDYAQVQDSTQEFAVLRHDIEFSVERAFAMAELEAENDIRSTYLVQITNNAYNAFSQKNLTMLRQMCEMGHHVGLHFHMGGLTQPEQVLEELPRQAEILSGMLGQQVDRFSFHRPPVEMLRANLRFPGHINLYDRRFFTFSEHADTEANLDVKYISDSRHQWNFGIPDDETLRGHKKVHLLVHPYSWTREGLSNRENFESLSREKAQLLLDTFQSECKHFASVRDMLSLTQMLESN